MSEIAPLVDLNPALISCRFLPDGRFELHYEGQSLDGQELILELDEQTTTRVAIADFVHDGEDHLVNAFTAEPDGSLTPWSRDTTAARSPDWSADAGTLTLVAVVAAIGHDDSLPPDQQAEFEPSTGYTSVRIRVRKKGSKPD